MSEVYSKGLQKEVQLELQMLEKLFPAIDELLELHTQHLLRLLERKKESQLQGGSMEGGFIINRIGDILVSQVRVRLQVPKLWLLIFFFWGIFAGNMVAANI